MKTWVYPYQVRQAYRTVLVHTDGPLFMQGVYVGYWGSEMVPACSFVPEGVCSDPKNLPGSEISKQPSSCMPQAVFKQLFVCCTSARLFVVLNL